jgi:hypothetical protein
MDRIRGNAIAKKKYMKFSTENKNLKKKQLLFVFLSDNYDTKTHLQEIVRCSFKLKLDLDVIPSLAN